MKELSWLEELEEERSKEVERMKRELRRKINNLLKETSQEWPHEEMVELPDVLKEIDQLDEPEVLSQEWIDSNSVYASHDGVTEEYVHVDELENLLVPKQEELESKIQELIEVYKQEEGAYSSPENGWIVGFIEDLKNLVAVEEELLYRARLKVITDEYIASYLRTQSSDDENRLNLLEIGNKYIYEDYRHLSEFTEDELKELGIWDSEQWVVEEVEE